MGESRVDFAISGALPALTAFDPARVGLIDTRTDFAAAQGPWQTVALRLKEGLSTLYRCEVWLARKEEVRPPPPPPPENLWDRQDKRLQNIRDANKNAANEWQDVLNQAKSGPGSTPAGAKSYADKLADEIGDYTGAVMGIGNTAKNAGADELQDLQDSFSSLDSIREQVLKEVKTEAWNGSPPPHPSEFLGSYRTIRIVREGDKILVHGRWLTGFVTEYEDLGVLGNGYRVIRILLVPELHKLSLSSHCRIFHDRTALEIIEEVLREAQVYAHGMFVSQRLSRVLPKREYTVQYGESDLAFVRRLLSEEALVFNFEHQEGAERFAIYDGASVDAGALLAVAYEQHLEALPISVSPSERDNQEMCWDTHVKLRIGTTRTRGRVVHFSNPRAVVEQQHPAVVAELAAAEGEVYVYPLDLAFEGDGDAGYQESASQRTAAQVELERIHMDSRVASAITNATAVAPGLRAQITGSPDPSDYHGSVAPAGAVRILNTTHRLVMNPDARLGGAKLKDVPFFPSELASFPPGYENRIGFYPADLPVRIAGPQVPRIHGLQTAVVVSVDGPSTDQPSHLSLDAMGRVLVRFPWDRRVEVTAWNDPATAHTCFVRVAQGWAGTGFGASFHPRIGMEVVVTFQDGHPDRPVVIGSVHNRANPFPVERRHIEHEGENQLPITGDPRLHYKGDGTAHRLDDERHLSMIRTRSHPPPPDGERVGYNELSFYDAGGHQRIRVHAEGVLDKIVRRDHLTKVANDQVNIVQGDQAEHIGGGSETDAGLQTLTVEGTRTKEIVGHEVSRVDGERHETVYGQDQIEIDGFRNEKVLGIEHIQIGKKDDPQTIFRELSVKGSRQTRVKGKDLMQVDMNRTLKITGNYQVGGNPLAMKAQKEPGSAGPAESELVTEQGNLKIKAKGTPGTIDLIARGGAQGSDVRKGKVDILARNMESSGDPVAVHLESAAGKRIKFQAGDVSLELSDDAMRFTAPRGIFLRCGHTSLTLGPAMEEGRVLHHGLTFVSKGTTSSAETPEGATPPETSPSPLFYLGLRSGGNPEQPPPPRELPKVPDYDVSRERDLAGHDMVSVHESTVDPTQKETLFAESGMHITGRTFTVESGLLNVLSEKGVNLQESGQGGGTTKTTRLLSDDEQDLFKQLLAKQREANAKLLEFKKAEHDYQEAMKSLRTTSKKYETAFANVKQVTHIYQGLTAKLEQHDKAIEQFKKEKKKGDDEYAEAHERQDDDTDALIHIEIAKSKVEEEERKRKDTAERHKRAGELFDRAYKEYQKTKGEFEKDQDRAKKAEAAMKESKAAYETARDELLALRQHVNRRTAPRTGAKEGT